MSARHGQGYATWLIMLPLLVVPLIAVFGVPQFAPISTQTADGADDEEFMLQPNLGSEAPLAESVPPFPGGTIEQAPPSSAVPPTERWSDPFENPRELTASDPQFENSGRTPTTPLPENGSGEPFNRSAPPESPVPPEEFWNQPDAKRPNSPSGIKAYSRDPVPGEGSRNSPDSRIDSATQLTWRQAVAHLNRLGVQKFQLSQTEEPFVFQFVCDLSRPNNPRVTHRFEAKAGEPLKAVENVIQQVETWSAQQAPR